MYKIDLCTSVLIFKFYWNGVGYLKFIDVWLIFCVLVPFLVFIVETIWELKRAQNENVAQDQDQSLSKSHAENQVLAKRRSQNQKMGKFGVFSSAWAESQNGKFSPKKDAIPFRREMKIGITLVTIILTIIYCIFAAYFYIRNDWSENTNKQCDQ